MKGERKMNIKGGYTNYGQDIGILMMPTVFPRLLGDIGNARTFKVPVRYHIVNDVIGINLNEKNAEEKLLQPFICAAQMLEAQGCKAITTSCSFLGGFQRELANSVSIPVFTTPLILVPMIHTMLSNKLEIGIFTMDNNLMTEEYFNQAGWSSEKIRVCVSGLSAGTEFSKLFIDDSPEGSLERLEQCVKELTERHMKAHPDTGAIVLECTNYAPFAKIIHKISGIPVFGLNQLVEFIDASVNFTV